MRTRGRERVLPSGVFTEEGVSDGNKHCRVRVDTLEQSAEGKVNYCFRFNTMAEIHPLLEMIRQNDICWRPGRYPPFISFLRVMNLPRVCTISRRRECCQEI